MSSRQHCELTAELTGSGTPGGTEMASPDHEEVSPSFVILIPGETSTRQRNRVSALLQERARARATSCWSWVWGEDQRQNDGDDQLELDAFAVLKADPGQVFWSTQVLALTSSEVAHEVGQRGGEVGKGREGMPFAILKGQWRGSEASFSSLGKY